MQAPNRNCFTAMNSISAAIGSALIVLASAFPAKAADDLLEPDVAFVPSARFVFGEVAGSERHGIDIDYRIASGYYLYRDRLRFEIVPPSVLIGAAEFPKAIEIDDPFVGKSSIFRENVTIHLPFAVSVVPAGRYRIRITAQGCAEDRFCYSPFKQDVEVIVPSGYRSTGPPSNSVPATGSPAR
jgi:thiol:disulfide interchange protein DsbD